MTSPSAPDQPAFPADPWSLLRSSRVMGRAVANVLDVPPAQVHEQLWREFMLRGSSVKRAADELGVTPYVFDEAMIRLYSESPAFVYELALWNHNLLKRDLRSWVTRWISKHCGPAQEVLTWGDGLGFDSLSLSRAGHRVTSFDLPGYTNTFARRMLAAAGAPVTMVPDPDGLPDEAFDAVVCLDVLEHVPDVPAELRRIRRCLRPGGVLVVHAPFYFVHRVSITHLRSNRKYSGSLALFREAGFSLVDGRPTWAPLVFVRDDGPPKRRPLMAWPRLALAFPFGLILTLGRFTTLPFEVINLVCRLGQWWFPDDMLRRRP